MIKNIFTLSLCLYGMSAFAQEIEVRTDEQKLSYTFGFQIGSQIRRQFANQLNDIDPKVFAKGIEDVLKGDPPAITVDEMKVVMQADAEKQQQKLAAAAAGNISAGEAHIKELQAKEGVQFTESGIAYEILKAGGRGKTRAAEYRGRALSWYPHQR